MAAYWLTFRIEQDSTYSTRYEKLIDAIRGIASKWWIEPTSFLLFESSLGIDQVASTVKSAINPRTDLALVGMPDYKSARIIGASTDDDLFDLMPFTKKA